MLQRARPVTVHSPALQLLSLTDTSQAKELVLHHLQPTTRMIGILTIDSAVSLEIAASKRMLYENGKGRESGNGNGNGNGSVRGIVLSTDLT